jgi:ubiquinone/menaquinone biosynthesis C-methylase UbiE
MSHHTSIAAGKSSYDLIGVDNFWQLLALLPGSTVLDLGSGAGRYTLPMAAQVGQEGKIIAFDLWEEGIDQLNKEAAVQNISNIDARTVDAGGPLPLDDQSVDVCFMAAVLHDFVKAGIAENVLREAARVLRSNGVMALVEFKKEDSPNGPPRKIRLAVEDLAMMVQRLGFIRFSGVMDLGPDLYLARFKRLGGMGPDR